VYVAYSPPRSFFLFQLVLDIPFLYLPAALFLESTRFTTILGAVALCYNIFLYSVLYLDIAFSHHVYFQQPANSKKKKQGVMCDDSSLRNILQSHPRREPKIVLQRAEYIFPSLKNSLVSVFVFVRIEQKAVNVYFRKIIFGNILQLN
jgi:hypothetical protein